MSDYWKKKMEELEKENNAKSSSKKTSSTKPSSKKSTSEKSSSEKSTSNKSSSNKSSSNKSSSKTSSYWGNKMAELEKSQKKDTSKTDKKTETKSTKSSKESEKTSEKKGGSLWKDVLTNIASGAYLGTKAQSGFMITDNDWETASEIKETSSKWIDEEGNKWLQKGALEGGVTTDNVSKAILGTGADLGGDLLTGAVGMWEKALDAIVLTSPYVSQSMYYQNGGVYNPETQRAFDLAAEEHKKDVAAFVEKDLYDEAAIANKIISRISSAAYTSSKASSGQMLTDEDWKIAQEMTEHDTNYVENEMEADSVLAEKSDALAQSAGELAVTAALNPVVPWFVTTGLTSFGGEAENAIRSGATNEEAVLSSAITAGAEILSEQIFGGISFGGKTLDNALTKRLARNISNKAVRTLAKMGVDTVGEGFEEILAGIMSAIGQKITYADDKELTELFSSEEAWEAFIGGAILGNFNSNVNAAKSSIQGIDFTSGLTTNEQAVVDKVYNDEITKQEQNGKKLTEREKSKIYDEILEDMDKGKIPIKTIEEVLGGDNVDAQGVFELVRNDRLVESYNEQERKKQDFAPDYAKYKGSKYEDAAKRTLDNAVKAGANNSNSVRDFVEFATQQSANTGLTFTFASGEQVKQDFIRIQSEKIAKIEKIPEAQRTAEQQENLKVMKDLLGKVQSGETIVNGNIIGGDIVLNLDSPKPLNRVVGHEVTHSFEGSEKNYKALHDAMISYAKAKKVDIEAKLAEYKAMYEGDVNADPEREMIADMVGDYLFSDADFVKHLSVEHRNVFQKIYDEIKYLCKIATAGSKELRELERVKRAFKEAYRAEKSTAQDGDAKYALESKTQPGRLDPRTVTKSDVVGLLTQVEEGTIYGNTYIPVRIGTPEKLIYWAKARRGEVIDNRPIAISADKAYNAMNREGETGTGRENALSTDEIVSMIEAMSDPQYIVYQGANDRYVEVVQFSTKKGDKAFAVIEIGNNKDSVYMNGYEGGLYNILVTTYPPKSGKLKELLSNSNNQVIYDKKKDASQRTSSSTVPSVLNDASFFDDTLTQDGTVVKHSLSDSNGKELTAEQMELRLNELRQERREIVDELDDAFFNGLSDEETRKLSNRLAKVDWDIDKLVAEERKASVLTSMQTILDNLGNYRRSDLESLAEQISDSAWDDYEELSRTELEGALREAIQGRELSPLEMQSKKWGLYVRPAPNVKQSLSNEGESFAPLTRFDTFGKDIAKVEAPVREDVVPVDESFASITDADAPPVAEISEEIAPAKAEAVAEEKEAKPVEEKTEKSKSPRQTLHNGIMDNIKSVFKEKGFDFDNVLKKAKNLSTFSTVDNTPQRVMEKALGYKEGQILSDITVNNVAQNETEGIKWLNSFTDRKNGLLAQISKQYNIKPGSKESAAAQMYAEGFYVDENNDIIEYGDAELAKDFPNAKVQANIKGLAGDTRIRQIYDDTLAMINESRTRNAYPEIPRLDNYFLHFRAMEDTFSKLGLPFNPNDIRAKDLPTDLNGVTADLKPGQPYFASAMHRTGKRTSFDLLGGLEKYLSSAKNQIYHIDDIQTLRALRNYVADTYGQANGLEGLDALSEEEAQERIEKVYDSHLSTFAKFLNEEANVLAGKTALIDRGLEGIIGRRGMTFLDTVNRQVGSNMVGFNISSSLTNFIPVAQTFAKTNKVDFVKAFGQTVANKVGSIFGRTDGFVENSPVAIRRKGADRFYRTPWQKVGDAGYALMSAVDDISTELIARTKYNELTRKGMDSQKAHYETDKWVSRLMGDRSLGQMPQLYNSKMLGLITKFQLEVRNQLDSQFYDTIQETKVSNEEIENRLARNAKTAAKVTSTFVQLAVAQHLFGKAFEAVTGYNPAFDIIEVLLTACGFDDDEDSEDTALDNIEQGFLALLEDLPYTSTFTGGRIPISSAMPIEELVKGVDEWGNEKSRWETLGEIAPYYALPTGYGQVKKTAQGLSMFSDDRPVAGSYTDSGNLRFPVDDTLENRIQAGIFGQWASENARDYFDNERSPLKEKQIQEFIDVDIPIRDYWEYREGLSGLDNLSEKADYINSLDLPVEKKNLLINNIADRKEDINMEEYDDYSSFEEFDFAIKNPEKYEIAEKVGGYEAYMGYKEDMKDMKLAEKAEYIANLDLTVEQKNALINGETDRKEPIDMTGYDTSTYSSFEEFEWAKEYPEKYTIARAVGGYEAYMGYSDELNDIHTDKDEYGKPIRGSREDKVLEYINNLDADYYTRIILWKSEYNSDNTYNEEIIEYINGRDDFTFKDRIAFLREIGFDVDDEGNIS